ncbi:MAG: N-acetylmuramoyl-L-alanine amidase [Cyanobacteria bacterium P01_A01_bin.84]
MMNNMRSITKLITHCSATPNDRDVSVKDIRNWHKQRGWSDIGYHYVIYRNGLVENGRPVEKIGAHCKGQNTGSIGVCLIGDDVFTAKQFESLGNLYNILLNIFPDLTIYGHRDFTNKKTCPNFNVRDVV